MTVELMKEIINKRIASRKKFAGKIFTEESAYLEITLLEGILREYEEKKCQMNQTMSQ